MWSWSGNAVNAAGYRVMSGATELSGDLPPEATSWLQTGLSTNTPHGPYIVRAFNAGGTGDSNPFSRYTLAAEPDGLAAATGAGLFAVQWSTNTNPEGTVYELQRSTSGGGFASVSTGTPSAERRTAVARPMPESEPVTIATGTRRAFHLPRVRIRRRVHRRPMEARQWRNRRPR